MDGWDKLKLTDQMRERECKTNHSQSASQRDSIKKVALMHECYSAQACTHSTHTHSHICTNACRDQWACDFEFMCLYQFLVDSGSWCSHLAPYPNVHTSQLHSHTYAVYVSTIFGLCLRNSQCLLFTSGRMDLNVWPNSAAVNKRVNVFRPFRLYANREQQNNSSGSSNGSYTDDNDGIAITITR